MQTILLMNFSRHSFQDKSGLETSIRGSGLIFDLFQLLYCDVTV